MDTRLQKLSYSSRLTLHTCPRKFQLYKLNSKADENEDKSQSVTFAFGHVVGLGIQEYITHQNINLTYWKCFLAWECDLLADNQKQKKSFWLAMAAIDRFASLYSNGYMKGWKLCFYKGEPATELSFQIKFPDGFIYVGFVDAVLQHEETGEVMVLECKTTSSNTVAAATYKNSAQAIGYSIVLDAIFPELSSYEVQYLIYKTKSQEYEMMAFQKDYLSRALWIREILLDIEAIQRFEQVGIYPMHGESCNDFYRECEYLSLCTLSTEALTEPLTPEESQTIQDKHDNDFAITLHLNDLITAQLSKS